MPSAFLLLYLEAEPILRRAILPSHLGPSINTASHVVPLSRAYIDTCSPPVSVILLGVMNMDFNESMDINDLFFSGDHRKSLTAFEDKTSKTCHV